MKKDWFFHTTAIGIGFSVGGVVFYYTVPFALPLGMLGLIVAVIALCVDALQRRSK